MSDDGYRIATTNVRSTLIPKGCTVRRCSRKGNELHESTWTLLAICARVRAVTWTLHAKSTVLIFAITPAACDVGAAIIQVRLLFECGYYSSEHGKWKDKPRTEIDFFILSSPFLSLDFHILVTNPQICAFTPLLRHMWTTSKRSAIQEITRASLSRFRWHVPFTWVWTYPDYSLPLVWSV